MPCRQHSKFDRVSRWQTKIYYWWAAWYVIWCISIAYPCLVPWYK